MNISELSIFIVKARKEQRLTQKDLAELAGVGITVIYKVENGDPGVTLKSFLSVLTSLGFDVRCRSPLGGEVSLGR
jgi:y4mF family transcriptional regulator